MDARDVVKKIIALVPHMSCQDVGGTHFDYAVQAVKEFADRQQGLAWTTEKPTQAGWYWWRLNANGYCCVHSIEDDTGELFIATSENSNLDELGGQWSGPLRTPKER